MSKGATCAHCLTPAQNPLTLQAAVPQQPPGQLSLPHLARVLATPAACSAKQPLVPLLSLCPVPTAVPEFGVTVTEFMDKMSALRQASLPAHSRS